MAKNYESGRSMVEILGTLAIIGVLSIGSIFAYSHGMDQYNANQITHDIMLRSSDLIMQSLKGRENLSLSEWQNEASLIDFSDPAYSDDGLIVFDIGKKTPISKHICQIIYNNLQDKTIQIDINEQRALSNDVCSKNNVMTFYFETNIEDKNFSDPNLCGKEKCLECQKCDQNTQTCVSVKNYTERCKTNESAGWCVNGECDLDDCISCGKDKYCGDQNTSCNTPKPSFCKKLEYKTVDFEYEGKKHTWYVSTDRVSWWEAKTICGILEKEMVTPNDFINIEIKDKITGTFPITDIARAFRTKEGSGYLCAWTTQNFDTCKSYAVTVETTQAHLTAIVRYINSSAYAVCR